MIVSVPFRSVLIALLVLLCVTGIAQSSNPLFNLLPSSKTGVAFNNKITESDSLNILNQANIYYGGGVGVGDFNNDGLVDLYFAGNMVSNRLYLNKGNLQFADVTVIAGVDGAGRWCTGVSVADVNADGLPDIYVSASFRKQSPLQRTNLLYINKGVNSQGIPQFTESAAAYGIADTGFSTQGYFFDYDKDGDLDLYQVTNELYDAKTPIRFRKKLTDGSALNTDRLYRNNGNGTFTNVSKQAGITIEGWGHAACITDINLDGWPDIYVANDFVSNDLCWINNHDGTFTNRLPEYFKHTGWNAMGTDAADVNNDGFVDFISLEMLPESNLRKKRMLSGNEYYNYTNSARFNYTHQYVRNVLQLNSGRVPGSHPVFSDVGYMAGIYQTDWSWCPLVADFDNDGLRDLIVSNGLPRDVTDLDYIAYNNGQGGTGDNFSLAMTDSLPIVKLDNYAFKNTNGLVFENATQAWGLAGNPSFSNGAAYADLDNDGDLDVIINNINDEATLYQNTSNTLSNQHYLALNFIGEGKNRAGIGATARIYYKGTQQYYEHQPVRGYLSTNDARAHFGLGAAALIDSIVITWPNGNLQLLTQVAADQYLKVFEKNAHPAVKSEVRTKALLADVTATYGLKYKPVEKDFVDYNVQPTIPHKLSQYGPGIAVGDIDKNGLEDFYLGGSSGNPGVFFMQNATGKFTIDSTRFLQKEDRLYEDMGVLLFDADNDKDLDLFIVGGSYEIPPDHPISQDRLFLNNGKGRFQKAVSAVPKDSANGSCVRAADFDGDGDLDLFVGGRVVSGAYPMAAKSYILRNDNGRFTDVTDVVCPNLSYAGMITDALWSDFDNDGKTDLIVTGEWMPVSFYRNTGKRFEPVSSSGVQNQSGWFNSLVAGDFDNDGDIDYIAGNLGLNTNYKASTAEPLTILGKDIDRNGSFDAMVFCYLKAEDGTMKPFPMATKDDLISQVIATRKKFPTYKSYGLATINEIWRPEDRIGAVMLQANQMASLYIENKGNNQFVSSPLPLPAQEAPVYGTIAEDFDDDGFLDVLMVGNDYGMEPYSGRHDAFLGLLLKGGGQGNFTAQSIAESGFFVKGDGKGLARLHTARHEDIYIATQNQDSLRVFSKTASAPLGSKWITLQPGDCSATITFADGSQRLQEFYYGSTFLSQSSRTMVVPAKATKIYISNYSSEKRQVL